MKPAAILNKYFNSDPETKVSAGQFAGEIKALSLEEKNELARAAAAELGVEFEEAG